MGFELIIKRGLISTLVVRFTCEIYDGEFEKFRVCLQWNFPNCKQRSNAGKSLLFTGPSIRECFCEQSSQKPESLAKSCKAAVHDGSVLL